MLKLISCIYLVALCCPTIIAVTIPSGCGVRAELGTRIVGGHTSFPGRWPWMAAFYRGNSQYCAGALISDRHILTASHCVANLRPEAIRVRLGEFDLNSNTTDSGWLGVRKIIMHSGYQPQSHLHDIAVLRLKNVVTFTPYVQRICLPPATNYSFEERTAVVAGWGTVAFLGSSSSWLREVEVPIWKNEECLEAMKKYVFDTTLCAGGKVKSADSCQGDSGGPLMMKMGDGRWAAIGVVSWGIRCGEVERPGVYTRVSSYTNWILQAVRSSFH